MYLSKSGKPIAVLPNIMLTAAGEHSTSVIVSVMLLTGPNNATWHEREIETRELPELWAAWLDDPELVLERLFAYDYEPGVEKQQRSVLSLFDLGL